MTDQQLTQLAMIVDDPKIADLEHRLLLAEALLTAWVSCAPRFDNGALILPFLTNQTKLFLTQEKPRD